MKKIFFNKLTDMWLIYFVFLVDKYVVKCYYEGVK